MTNPKTVLNRRASVEATVRSVIHPLGGHLCKLPVRGKSRITTMIAGSAAMVNVRRIASFRSLMEAAVKGQRAGIRLTAGRECLKTAERAAMWVLLDKMTG